MSDDFELVRGSGNVFRDFDMPNPDLAQPSPHFKGEYAG